jgi:hypothetical protein
VWQKKKKDLPAAAPMRNRLQTESYHSTAESAAVNNIGKMRLT